MFSLLGLHLPPAAKDFYALFKGAYSVLGMMIIGLGLGSLHHLKSDFKFTGFVFAGKFICWPLGGLAFLSRSTGWPLATCCRLREKIIMLISVMPVAANAVAFATHLKVEPEKAATVVLLSTLFALVYVPLVMGVDEITPLLMGEGGARVFRGRVRVRW